MKHDKHRRLMTDTPSQDIPMKRFRENIDIDKLELFLSEDERYQSFIAALHSPVYARHSFAAVARKFNISLHEMQTRYIDGMRHMGLIEMANNLPQVSADISKDALSVLEVCSRCDGRKAIHEEGDWGERECPACKGMGEVRVHGDYHARDLMFESLKLTGRQAPVVAIQQNFNSVEETMIEIGKIVEGDGEWEA